MTTVLRRNSLCLTLVAVVALSLVTMPRAHAGDFGKILGALAAGYVAYEVLDSFDDCRPCTPSRQYPNQRYNPPPSYYHGGEAKYWYKEGYGDGFKDGADYGTRKGFNQGYRVGYQDGDRNGYKRGVRKGYSIGYGDGYGDGHFDGFIEGVHHPSRRRR